MAHVLCVSDGKAGLSAAWVRLPTPDLWTSLACRGSASCLQAGPCSQPGLCDKPVLRAAPHRKLGKTPSGLRGDVAANTADNRFRLLTTLPGRCSAEIILIPSPIRRKWVLFTFRGGRNTFREVKQLALGHTASWEQSWEPAPPPSASPGSERTG